ncbi:nuclear transport factor 2 family protein [Actinoplanes sp. NPDC051851]|uniref:nuclear transport factor 2 family protein n=1 Tax=Actinoplanes sp. NPDC051851 TaxID=3154753 RepID=UPI00343EACE7
MSSDQKADALVRRLQECFNTRRFDDAAPLHAPDFFSHPLGAGFPAGKDAWLALTTRYPAMRVVAQDVILDGDKAAVRSVVEGIDGARPELYEIFRFEDGRFAEMWGASTGFPWSGSPRELLDQDADH